MLTCQYLTCINLSFEADKLRICGLFSLIFHVIALQSTQIYNVTVWWMQPLPLPWRRVPTHLDYPSVYLFISCSTHHLYFKAFQWVYLPKAHISRTNGRVPLSEIINMLQLRSQRIVLACLKRNRLHLCVHVVAADLLTENEDWWKKIRSEWCVGSKVTFLSVLPNLQQRSCQAARVIISLGHGQLRLKLNYSMSPFFKKNLEFFPSPTLHMLWI